MKNLSRILMVALTLITVTACSSGREPTAPANPGSNAYGPQPGDNTMLRGDVRIDSANVSLAESYPAQVMLHFAYFQPTPCYRLRVEPSQPDAQNRIYVTAYAVTEKDKACALMALSTPLKADMSLGSYPKGHYSIWLNGVRVGEFDS